MNCPRCKTELVKEKRLGIDVDECPVCEGMWLDTQELDLLEDRSYDEDELKGTLVFKSTSTADQCPHCGTLLAQFQYRLYDLELEYCPAKHGYWLDKGENERVGELMEQRESDMERSREAQTEWSSTLRRLRAPSFFDKIRDLFK